MEAKTTKVDVATLRRIDVDGNLKAYADLIIADAIMVKGFRVVSGKNGLFVSMPREQGKDGKWYETVRPLRPEVRNEIAQKVLGVYKEAEDTLPTVVAE